MSTATSASYAFLLHRLERLKCPHSHSLRNSSSINSGSLSSADTVDLFDPALTHTHAALLQATDPLLDTMTARSILQLRYTLLTWLLEQYDSELMRTWQDSAQEYAHQKSQQTMLYQFKRLHEILHFLGVLQNNQNALGVLTGVAPIPIQLNFFHTLCDMVIAVSSSPAASTMTNAVSYTVQSDMECMRHVQLMHHIIQSTDTTTQQSQSQLPHILTESIDLFSPSIMLAANTNRQLKEKSTGPGKRGIPDYNELCQQVEKLQREIDSKTLVLQDLQQRLPLTTSEDYIPSLTQLESDLSSLQQLLSSFTHSYPSHYHPLIHPLLNTNTAAAAQSHEISSLGPQIKRVVNEKRALDTVLSACIDLRTNINALTENAQIRDTMHTIQQAKITDERMITKLGEMKKIFEASRVRVEKVEKRKEEAAMMAAAAAATMNGGASAATGGFKRRGSGSNFNITSPSPRMSGINSFSMTTPFPSLHVSTASFSSPPTASITTPSMINTASILTSSRDLSLISETFGEGSAGVFSPVKASTLPLRLVTRTGATDTQAMELSRRRREQEVEEERKRIEMETPVSSRQQHSPYQPLSTYNAAAPSSSTFTSPSFTTNTFGITPPKATTAATSYSSPYTFDTMSTTQQLSLAHLQ